MLLLLASPSAGGADPNGEGHSPRPALDFHVFRGIDATLPGLWDLEIPRGPKRRLEIKYIDADDPRALVGIDVSAHQEILRLEKKKKGIGYEGYLMKVLGACGFDQVTVSDFVLLGDAIALKFVVHPTPVACPAIDNSELGYFTVVSPSGEAVRLRDHTDLSSPNIKNTYSIGGDRPNVQVSALVIPLGAVAVEPGTKVKFLRRFKAPLDGRFWFQVEVPLAEGSLTPPPQGYLKAEALQFVGSFMLKRVE